MEAGQLLPEPGISGRDCTWCSPMRHMVAEKRGVFSFVAAVDRYSGRFPVQCDMGGTVQICISLLCIFDPVCAHGTL